MKYHKKIIFFLWKTFIRLTKKTKNTQLPDLFFGKSVVVYFNEYINML